MLNWRDPKSPLAGGAERVTRAYLEGLVARGHEVCWFTHAYPDCVERETLGGIQIIRAGDVLSRYPKVLGWYRKQPRFDLVIDQHHGVPWFAPWWCRTNCVAFLHEVLGPIWDCFYRWPKNTIGKFQERWIYWFYRNVPFWTGCESTRRQLQEFGVRNVSVISYGVDTRALDKPDERPLIPPFRLAMVSRLAPNKRVAHGIRALKALRDRSVDARLTIMGSGMEEGELRRLAAELGLRDRVEFAGRVSEEEKLSRLKQSHVLLHTSVREGWGLNVVEANAMATPAVVYPVPGLVDSTCHLQTGLVAERETPDALADSLDFLLKNESVYQKFRNNAWRHAQSMHWSAVLPGACDWLEKMAKGG